MLARISWRGKEALLDMHWITPSNWQARAIAFSPEGCTSFANAAGETNRGRLTLWPRIFEDVDAWRTSRKMRGRRRMRSKVARLEDLVTRSVAAES